MERFHMKLLKHFQDWLHEWTPLLRKLLGISKWQQNIEGAQGPAPQFTHPWCDLEYHHVKVISCKSDGLTLWVRGNNSRKKVNTFKASEDDDSGDHNRKEENSTWKHDEEETSEWARSQSISKRKAVVLDLRTSLAAQLCFLVLQEDPWPSHPLNKARNRVSIRLMPLPV